MASSQRQEEVIGKSLQSVESDLDQKLAPLLLRDIESLLQLRDHLSKSLYEPDQ